MAIVGMLLFMAGFAGYMGGAFVALELLFDEENAQLSWAKVGQLVWCFVVTCVLFAH